MTTPVSLPAQTRDLEDVADIEQMVRRFYASVAQDDLLGPIFNDVAEVDWSEHIPRLAMFWSRALFGVQGYSGNPYREHRRIHELSAFRPEHFERWLDLFHGTIDLRWTGPVAERAKELVRAVAEVHSKQLTGTAFVYDAQPLPRSAG